MHTRQGVYFMHDFKKVETGNSKFSLTYSVQFVPDNGDMIFNFVVNEKKCS